MPTKIQYRRDTAANWASANPVLSLGEPALESDTGLQKLGDGTTLWNALPYSPNAAAINSKAPLPAASKNALTGWYHADGFGVDRTGATTTTTAIQSAITKIKQDGGSGKFYFPGGTYRTGQIDLGGCNSLEIIGAGRGATIFMAPTGLTNTQAYIFSANTAASGITFRDMTFQGTAVDDTAGNPRRGRTYSAYGFNCAIRFTGDLVGSGPVISDIAAVNVEVIGSGGNNSTGTPTYSGLPILLSGVRGEARVEGSRFYNTLDVGWTFNESAVCINNVSINSADNGFSISRGNQSIVATGNRVKNCCYWGIWVAGFNTDLGPNDFTVTGNTIKNAGYGGVIANSAAMWGNISGNTIDCGYNRGPSDGLTDSYGCGVYIGGYPSGTGTPTTRAANILVAHNTIRTAPRAGVIIVSATSVKVSGNLIADTGTQYLADGTTAILSSDQNNNCGVLVLNPVNTQNITVDNNTIIDERATPYQNWSIIPIVAPTTSTYWGNTHQGLRNPWNLQEQSATGSGSRVFRDVISFTGNSKHVGGATAGSNSAGGLTNGFDVNGIAGNIRPVRWLTAGSERWRLYADTTAEGGSNAGSNLVLESKTDAAGTLATIFTILRNGGITLGVQGQTLTIASRLVTGAGAVSIAAGANASAVSAGGNGATDLAGTVNATVVASGAVAGGALAVITFATAYTTTPHVVISAQTSPAQTCAPYVGARSNTGFSIFSANVPAAGTSLQYDYVVVG